MVEKLMFEKILIANRGEIAVRIMRSAQELDIKVVAIYEETDKDAFHIMRADEAICVGPGPRKDYLNIEKIIEAARKTGAQAIHPGYGFLAENPDFPEACTNAKPGDADLEQERSRFQAELGRPVSDEDLGLYLQFPFDATSFFKFEDRYGKTWLLPPEVWFRRGGFKNGERITFADEFGVPHYIEVISTRGEGNNILTTLLVDHSFQTLSVKIDGGEASPAPA